MDLTTTQLNAYTTESYQTSIGITSHHTTISQKKQDRLQTILIDAGWVAGQLVLKLLAMEWFEKSDMEQRCRVPSSTFLQWTLGTSVTSHSRKNLNEENRDDSGGGKGAHDFNFNDIIVVTCSKLNGENKQAEDNNNKYITSRPQRNKSSYC